ncbi:hypothetical protein KY495_08925 [Massilia sp. PAMC28688]|uniref:DUF6600 domain-containing protein n=1 Tax=Massilia sp. PAMC28688 TaxID=2861283 RepID=UPI001C633DF1|nr:DUF6600 domain-containing protein [Massilia sp. PAMC28688]QYF95255.1 hypothetical protein KY495_08925 [Massilia sp. PAMC28688]
MSTRFLRTATLVAFAAFSTYSYAQDDSPGRVGRIAMIQGQVDIAGDVGEEVNAGMVNWPVTSRNQITTGRDGRTEIRIGSTAIRLDADSSLDVTELDDETLRLHLHYGSVNIRVRNPDLARGFELTTPDGLVRLDEVGQLRVDTGRRRDQTVVSVFTGQALVDGGGERITVCAGRRAEFGRDELRTSQAMRDSFDEWSMLRDQRADRSESVRYVTSEMTGYEDLDQHGSWRDSHEYGPLWSPRHVPSNWAPYRDGRWTYLQPWGWTWVDNAPWGYAPSHYGRWVMVDRRWCWAPGRNISRVVWSPALVGWVGGGYSVVTFGSARLPAQGWYPLTPYDEYRPGYRMRGEHLRHVNRHVRKRDERTSIITNTIRKAGLTVVPQSNFAQRGTVVVPTAPRPSAPTGSLITDLVAKAGMPPAPRDYRPRERRQEVQPRTSAFTGLPGQAPQFGVGAQPRGGRYGVERRGDEPAPAAAPVAAGVVSAQPAPAVIAEQQRGERGRRGERDPDLERDRRPRGAESFQMQQAQQRQQQMHHEQQRDSMVRQAAMQAAAQQRQQQAIQQQAAQQQAMQQAAQQQAMQQAAQQQAMHQAAQQQAMQQAAQQQAMQQRQQQEQAMQQRDQQEHARGIRGMVQRAAERQEQQQREERQRAAPAPQQTAPVGGFQRSPDELRRRAKEDMR